MRIPALLICALVSAPCAAEDFSLPKLFDDARLYATSPLRWDGRDWAWFGGTLLAVGTAHEFDDRVRTHFDTHPPLPGEKTDPHSTRDYGPAAAMIGLTWAYATLIDDRNGYREGRSMVEAAAFSAGSVTLLKLAAGRRRPNETSSPDEWFKSGSSFPSMHVGITYAVGTVLAESGNEDFRWVRRALGYGLATAVAYSRVHDGQHWLSDTVAAAALGVATGRFVMNQHTDQATADNNGSFGVMPLEGGGAMLTYQRIFN